MGNPSSSFWAGHEAWVVFSLKREIQDSNSSLKVLRGKCDARQIRETLSINKCMLVELGIEGL